MQLVSALFISRYSGCMLFEYDGAVPLEQATAQEVAQAAWMTKAQIRQLFDAGQMVHTLSCFFETEGLKRFI